ncbi:isoaspartyl peptidase/L-asparaginase family protein [Sphingomonas morindae]|uniref:Isoaspartyl peptidase/L-asparaginase n=1 Tax=Sphingomonas morindae TaxID=1541170 RepID=A0ABY4XB28_9SPHN|nr:isoaspartyl peptidase/L-asparaginase [Sphingomonas morindae]USI74154.1 isoaspartyl peptidase/L-asparaginase [Sphingomonas morindae]
MAWTVMIHGGSGAMAPGRLSAAEEQGAAAGLRAALAAAAALLEAGGSAVDAVEAAVRVLEDDPHFNAGRGSVFTWEGGIECDAAIMDGRDRRAGAAAGLTATRNPVSLARAVMRDTPHVLLAGAGADAFSRARGAEQAPPDWFATPERRRQLDEIKARPDLPFDSGMKYGTVGAVARDSAGHVAAATSTGGLTAKRWGRIGDSPLIGAGTYADDRAAAISCTGSGEHFIRMGLAHELCARLRLAGATPDAAADAVLAELGQLGGKGGFILVTPRGEACWRFNTPGMYRGRIAADTPAEIAIYR